MKRKPFIYLLFLSLTIPLGLATRLYPDFFPAFISEYGGDTLWAFAGFLIAGILWRKKSTPFIAIIAAAFGLCIELSQLYTAPWMESLRDTLFGYLVLGRGFLLSDLVCYTIGIAMGIMMEFVLRNFLFHKRQT